MEQDDQEGVRTVDDDNFIDDTGVDPADRYGSDNERHSPGRYAQVFFFLIVQVPYSIIFLYSLSWIVIQVKQMSVGSLYLMSYSWLCSMPVTLVANWQYSLTWELVAVPY